MDVASRYLIVEEKPWALHNRNRYLNRTKNMIVRILKQKLAILMSIDFFFSFTPNYNSHQAICWCFHCHTRCVRAPSETWDSDSYINFWTIVQDSDSMWFKKNDFHLHPNALPRLRPDNACMRVPPLPCCFLTPGQSPSRKPVADKEI